MEANAPKITPPRPIPRERITAQARIVLVEELVLQLAHERRARGRDDLELLGGREGDAELDALRTCQQQKKGRETAYKMQK
jgi:hypothetical protein